VLAAGRVQLVGDIAEVIERHRVLVGPADELARIEGRFQVIEACRGQRQASALVALGEDDEAPAGWHAAEVSLEELVLALLRQGRVPDKERSGIAQVPETSQVTA
jgi:ABC-2 type transport system ATP-binding protein